MEIVDFFHVFRGHNELTGIHLSVNSTIWGTVVVDISLFIRKIGLVLTLRLIEDLSLRFLFESGFILKQFVDFPGGKFRRRSVYLLTD